MSGRQSRAACGVSRLTRAAHPHATSLDGRSVSRSRARGRTRYAYQPFPTPSAFLGVSAPEAGSPETAASTMVLQTLARTYPLLGWRVTTTKVLFPRDLHHRSRLTRSRLRYPRCHFIHHLRSTSVFARKRCLSRPASLSPSRLSR